MALSRRYSVRVNLASENSGVVVSSVGLSTVNVVGVGLLTGPRGPQGATGATGSAGLQGPIGPIGPIGPPGVAGSMHLTTKTANYTLTDTDDVVLADTTSSAVTITLHSAVTATKKPYTITRINTGPNTLLINTTSSQTINGQASISLWLKDTSLDFMPDGSNWRLV